MKIRLLVIGKTEEEYLRKGISEYTGRVKRYVPFEIVEIPSPRNISSLPLDEQKSKEAVRIEKQIRTGDLVVLLDEHGQELTSAAFSKFLNQRFLSGARNMNFIIGGPFGFDESLHKQADFILSLSKMTFSHQMIRLFFTEQLYRALTILRGESYHHD